MWFRPAAYDVGDGLPQSGSAGDAQAEEQEISEAWRLMEDILEQRWEQNP